ncbi:MAG: glycosyltransferase family 4 protein [Kiritimatiellae bacterium]|nr:glycosyltransferase family 4 protein [Kiritimatiellia bacterium]
MHILFIQPGSGGGFYCQNCLRDISICDALRQAGHEVTMLPLYLPATADATAPDDTPVFYSAVTLYLRHKYRWLRRLPRAWFKPLDSWPVLKLAAKFAGTTSAGGLEELTLSMLRGMEGAQAEELTLLAEWIEALPAETRPNVIILSNALLMGLAKRLKQATGAPILCWLQDEHVWTDAMHASLQQAVLQAMRDDAHHVDRFIAVSQYYRNVMSSQLGVDPETIDVIFPGVNPADYIQSTPTTGAPRKIGFLSRLSADEGFDCFVDAFIELRREPRFCDVRLAATGGAAPDKKFLARQLRKLRQAGLGKDVEISYDRFARDRFGFLAELTLLCVPGAGTPEAFGYYAVEALAAGVPVVLPKQGAFPEFVSLEQGGVLLEATDAKTIAGVWADLLTTPAKLQILASAARRAANTTFNERLLAEELLRTLRSQTSPSL